MLKRIVPISLLAISLSFFSFVSIGHADNNIHVGVIGPMKYAEGMELWNGAVLAAEEVNHNGGVKVGKGSKGIKLIKIDSNEFVNISTATNAIEMLFFRNKVDFVVGGFRSEAVLAMQQVAMDHKKIFISAGAAAPELTRRVAQNYDRYKYYFRGGTLNNFDLGRSCLLQLAHVAQNLRKKLGLGIIKVAIAAEKAVWADGMIAAAKKEFPGMGLELAGVFRPSSYAKDVSPTVRAIADTKAQLVLTLFSSEVGIAFVEQASDYSLPAMIVGINAAALRSDFWESTKGKANYIITLAPFAPNVEMSSLTKPFLDKYTKRFGEMPGYTAGGTYAAIADTLIPAIKEGNTLDSDSLVKIIESSKYETPQGIFAYKKDKLGRPTHDLTFGTEYALPLAIQWQDGKMKGVWPKNYYEKPGDLPFTYKGIAAFKIPQWVVKEHKRS